MPSTFLVKRFREFLKEISGVTTVKHISFDSSATSSLYGDVDESSAYGGVQTPLPARLEMFPSRAYRELEGIGINFESIIRLSKVDVDEVGIELKIGDAFILPDMEEKRYVVKISPTKQSGEEFFEYLVMVTRQKGSRG